MSPIIYSGSLSRVSTGMKMLRSMLMADGEKNSAGNMVSVMLHEEMPTSLNLSESMELKKRILKSLVILVTIPKTDKDMLSSVKELLSRSETDGAKLSDSRQDMLDLMQISLNTLIPKNR